MISPILLEITLPDLRFFLAITAEGAVPKALGHGLSASEATGEVCDHNIPPDNWDSFGYDLIDKPTKPKITTEDLKELTSSEVLSKVLPHIMF